MTVLATWCIVCAIVCVLCWIQMKFFDDDIGEILVPLSAMVFMVSLAISFVTGVIVLWHIVNKWILTNFQL